MDMKSKIAAIAVSGCLAASAGLIAGCSSDAASSSSSASSSAAMEVEEETLAQVGDIEGAAYVIEATNATGKAIEGVQVRSADGAEYAPLAMDGAWAADETVEIGFPQAEQAEGGDVQLRAQYDVQVTYADGTTGELHGLVPEGMTETELKIDAETGLTYIAYVNESDEAADTLAAEKAFKEQAEEEAAEAPAAEPTAVQPSAPVEPTAVDPGYTYDYSYTDTGSTGSAGSTGTSDPSQSEDQCVDGGVQLR